MAYPIVRAAYQVQSLSNPPAHEQLLVNDFGGFNFKMKT